MSSLGHKKSADVRLSGRSIEVMNVEGASKPVILRGSYYSKNKKAKRRWKLLKNVSAVTRRRTSLTDEEEKFLSGLNATNASPSSAVQSCTRRASVKTLMALVNLTIHERNFLAVLTESEEVTDEQLETCKAVLEKDSLFSDDQGEEETKKAKRLTTQRDASFRGEVWNHYESLPHIEEVNKSPPKPKPVERKKSGGGGNFFQNLFGGGPKEVVKKDEDNDIEEHQGDVRYSVLGTTGNDEDCRPNILSPYMMDALRKHMPFVVSEDNFWLKYSMTRNGASMRMLLKQVRSSARTVIAVETFDGNVFGSFTSSPWRANGRKFYGSGETFLWKLKKCRYTPCETVEDQVALEKEIEVFKWSGKNYNIQALINHNSNLMIGGGGDEQENDPTSSPIDDEGNGSGLIINSDMEGGTSDSCTTYNSPTLNDTDSKESLFQIANIEVWTLTPVSSLDQAQQLELGRQFIFDHGNFVNS